MADLKISQLPTASLPVSGSEVLPIVQSGITDQITIDNLLTRLTVAPPAIGTTTPAAGSFTDLTSSGNTILGNASTDTLNVGNGDLIKDASGNTIFNGAVLLKAPVAIGYTTGAGGTVTQLTSKSTPVTINKPCGQVIMNTATLNAGAAVTFRMDNSMVGVNDIVLCSVGLSGAYTVEAVVGGVAGQVYIRLASVSLSNLSEAVQINFAIIKAVIA